MSARFDPATTEESVRLGDLITDWTWKWEEQHPRAKPTLKLWMTDLQRVIDANSDLTNIQAWVLARDITAWARVWHVAADKGYADMDFAGEWRHSLMRYLALTDEQRQQWLAQPYNTKLEDVHIAGGA